MDKSMIQRLFLFFFSQKLLIQNINTEKVYREMEPSIPLVTRSFALNSKCYLMVWKQCFISQLADDRRSETAADGWESCTVVHVDFVSVTMFSMLLCICALAGMPFLSLSVQDPNQSEVPGRIVRLLPPMILTKLRPLALIKDWIFM